MDAMTIFDRMANKYSRCASYRDCGTAEFADSRRTIVDLVEFTTYFVRPCSMRFEFRRTNARFGNPRRVLAIGCDGTRCFEDLDIYDGIPEEARTLSLAVAGATGLSAAAAYTVLPMLIDELRAGGRSLLQWRKIELIGQELVNPYNCYVLKSTTSDYDENTFWISTEELVIRRIRCEIDVRGPEELRHFGEYTFTEVTFDESIDPTIFQWTELKDT